MNPSFHSMDIASSSNKNKWKCLKHASQRSHGICPGCLSERLTLLCPDCPNLRPCGCLSSPSSSSSSSLPLFDPPRSSVRSRGIGEVGRVGSLIDGEHAFRRSRSVAFRFARSRSSVAGENRGDEREKVGGRRRGILFWFLEKMGKEEEAAPEKKILGWNWHFPSPIIAFSNRKSEKVLEDGSASRSGESGSFWFEGNGK